MNITLRLENDKVFCNNKELKINKQQTKNDGKGCPVVDIEPVVGPEYQKWISVSRLNQGDNDIEIKERKAIQITRKVEYYLNEQEKEKIKALQAQIDEIMEAAKKRSLLVKKANPTDVSKLSQEEKLELIKILQAQLGKSDQ